MHPAHTSEPARFAPIVALDGGEAGRSTPFALEVAGHRNAHDRLACAMGALIDARASQPDRPLAVMVSLTLEELEGIDVDAVAATLIPAGVELDRLMIRVPYYAAGARVPSLERLAATGLTVVVTKLVVRTGELGLLAGAPVDMIELPPALVDDIDRSREGAEQARTWLDVAHQVDWLVLARNVRRPSQARALRELGCDLAAGPLMGAPIDPTSHGPLIKARGTRPPG